METKKGLKRALEITGTVLVGAAVALIWVLKQPPKIVRFILNNKFKSLLAAAAIYFGYGKVKNTIRYNRDIDNEVNRIRAEERIKEQARQEREQRKAEYEAAQKSAADKVAEPKTATPVAPAPAADKAVEPTNTATNAPTTTAATNAPAKPAKKLHPMQVATKQVLTDDVKTNSVPTPAEERAVAQAKKEAQEAEKLTQEAAEAATKNAFVSSPTVDMVARSGDRAAPAEMRFRHFLNKGAKENGATDVGDNTLLICSQKDPKNYVVLYLGYHNVPKGEERQYTLWSASVTTKTGYPPFIGCFNIQFSESPGMRLGLAINEKGMEWTNYQRRSPVINLTKNSGKTLLQVDENGGLHHVFDPKVVESAFAQVDATQTSEVDEQPFIAYKETGAPNRARQTRVPRPGFDR